MRSLHPEALDIADIGRAAAALAHLLDEHDPTTAVPTCGDWTMADLVWHLTEVQRFWSHVIAHRPAAPDADQELPRPADADLAAGLRSAGETLVDLLSRADPQEPAWSWSDDHTVGFTIRRQIHESLIHFMDGVLAVDEPVPHVDPLLAADGIDEMVGVMLTGTPEWATFIATDDVVALRAVDTGDRWVLRAGTVDGIVPGSDEHLELAGYEVDGAATPTATIEAPALELLLWMWGRRPTPDLASADDEEAADLLRRTIVDATQ